MRRSIGVVTHIVLPVIDGKFFFVLENPQLDWGFSLALAVINKQKNLPI